MKRLKYVTINLKQVLTVFAVSVLSAALVFGFNLIYIKTSAVAPVKKSNLPLVIIDAGHGGEDGGTVSESGIVEKNINLSVSQKLENLFVLGGFEVKMTRDSDTLINDENSASIREKKVSDIHNRMKIMQDNPNGVFISIHQNHFSQSQYSGAQVFYSKGNPESEKIAQFIQQQIKSSLQKSNERKIKPSGTQIYLLYHAVTPAVMVECGFLSNREEAKLLNSEAYQTKMARAIFDGVINYINSLEK